MAIRYFNDSCTYRLPEKRRTREWLVEVAREEGYAVGEINYIFCSAERLLEINREFLHFTDPGHWAIWDSNVYAAIEFIAAGKPDEKIASFCLGNYARVNNKHSFEKYQHTLREVSAETGLPIREIEKRLFYVGRKLKETAKNLQNNCQK